MQWEGKNKRRSEKRKSDLVVIKRDKKIGNVENLDMDHNKTECREIVENST